MHRIMVPYGIKGTVVSINEGEYTVEDTVAVIRDESGQEKQVRLMQKWPVRIGRPYKKKRRLICL